MATALVAAAGPVLGAGFGPPGDGSSTDNPDLLRDATSGCENCQQVPNEYEDPPFYLDWQLGLRGAVTQTDEGTKFEVLALPRATITVNTMRGGYSVGAAAEISRELDGDARIGELSVDGRAEYHFDAITSAALRGSLTLSQDDPDEPGYASNVTAAPLVMRGELEAEARRDLGLIDALVRARVGRTVNGETTYDDDSTSSNDHQNVTVAGLGTRLGYELTPGLTAFVDGGATHEGYEAASPSLLAKLDNVTYEGRAGLNARFLTVFEVEGSLGLGHRDFADASLEDITAVLYDGRVVLRPDPTLTLTGTLSTRIDSPGTTAGATAKLTYAATGEAAYHVNPWLRLRASAGWSEAHFKGIATDEYKWNAGVGADYMLSEHMDATADYTFTRSTTTPAAAEDEQRVMVGVTIHR